MLKNATKKHKITTLLTFSTKQRKILPEIGFFLHKHCLHVFTFLPPPLPIYQRKLPKWVPLSWMINLKLIDLTKHWFYQVQCMIKVEVTTISPFSHLYVWPLFPGTLGESTWRTFWPTSRTSWKKTKPRAESQSKASRSQSSMNSLATNHCIYACYHFQVLRRRI